MEFELMSETFKCVKSMLENLDAVKSLASEKAFKSVIERQLKDYQTLSHEIEGYASGRENELNTPTLLDKAMVWGGLMLNTIKSRSASKLSEIILHGITAGEIAINRAINDCELSEVNTKYADKLICLLEDNRQTVKTFL